MVDKNILHYKGKEEAHISIETLQNEMAQYLQMDNLCFLIGAGCSSNIVKDGQGNEMETGIPCMASLYEGFFLEHSDFKIMKKSVKDLFGGNLEKLIEAMEATDVVNQIKLLDGKISSKISLVKSFLRRKVIEGLESSEVHEIYKTFYKKIPQKSRANPISIFTTNYDLFNEMALDDLGFSYNDGFSGTYKRKFNPISYEYMYVENMNLDHDVWDRVPSFFNLIKLHGSITWIREGNQIREVDYKNMATEESVMMYPTPMKDRSTLMTPYSDLLRIMENRLLKKNCVLIVLGYSFGDDHINRIILNGLASQSFRLVVFGSGKNIEELVERNDPRIIVINSDDKIQYFKNFVEKVLPSVNSDIEETLNISAFNNPTLQKKEGENDE